MTDTLLITGGKFRPRLSQFGAGRPYHEAQLVSLDLRSGEFAKLLCKSDGGERYPSDDPNQLFTVAAIEGDILWLPSETEIFKYQLPRLTLLDCYSHPCFNNIHSVRVYHDELVITSTGLDNVVFLNKFTGAITRILNAEGKDPWHRFAPDTDYRIEASTRPHDCHPNYVFELDDTLWVTRCVQEDAVNLEDPTQRIDITLDDTISVHDGVHYEDYIVFTRVDGLLVFCGKESKRVEKIVDPFKGRAGRPIGWARGLCIDGDISYIGYSRIRETKVKSRLKYLMHGNFQYAKGHPALVVAFNIRTGKIENIYQAPKGTVDAIYGILPVPANMTISSET